MRVLSVVLVRDVTKVTVVYAAPISEAVAPAQRTAPKAREPATVAVPSTARKIAIRIAAVSRMLPTATRSSRRTYAGPQTPESRSRCGPAYVM